MGKLLSFNQPADEVFVGPARCMKCDHNWERAEAHEGEWQIECPECKTMNGVHIYPFAPGDDETIRECSCGGQLFWLKPTGHMCAKCGRYQNYDND